MDARCNKNTLYGLLWDPEKTLGRENSRQKESNPHLNAQISDPGRDPTMILDDLQCTIVCAPSALRDYAVHVACASVRKKLQKATLAHIRSRRLGATRETARLERLIASLRAKLADLDPRLANRSEPSTGALGWLRRILAKVRFGPTL